MSPSTVAEAPNPSMLSSVGSTPLSPLSLRTARIVPSPDGAVTSRRTMCTVPALAQRASSPVAPTARSSIPSRSRSPIRATDRPNSSPAASCGPLAVEALISAVRFTVPSWLRNSRWTAPVSLKRPHAPAARSGTPSLSRSPTAAADEPKKSLAASRGPLAVEALISAVLFTVPSGFMYSRWTAPASVPPASSPTAPTAMSPVPSRSRSPIRATDRPNSSPAASCGPLAVEAFIGAVRFTVPSELRNIT